MPVSRSIKAKEEFFEDFFSEEFILKISWYIAD
jgi:hypothetical protein